ncbi:DNA repair exonuclease [Candidatus Pacearchaeota archaeon]|nr:DNA repair exonuclease [Candidatus Pacearchaeota archaeon]
MKFAHLGDCHLGGWRQPELKDLNLRSFQEAIRRIIAQKIDFVLISGDLFDSSYPPIDTLRDTFEQFRKLKENNIPVFLIAGSHDYSVSGKTFLDVLEKAGFCTNVSIYEEKNNFIILQPTLYKNIAIYGYPGKKSGLEIEEIKRIKLQDSPLFKILLLHTTIRDAIGNIPINAVEAHEIPRVDYLALAHLHINYNKEGKVYSGPTFPNNLSELEELQAGSFYIFHDGKIRKEEIKLKEILSVNLEINNALTATEKILNHLFHQEIKDKIVIIRLSGVIETGKMSDIDFQKVESFLKEKKAYTFLKSTSKLHLEEPEIKLEFIQSENMEEQIIKNFAEKNPNVNNFSIPNLFRALEKEKLEDETNSSFEDRLLSEVNQILSI